MNAKHQFKYTYNEIDVEEYSPHEVTFEMPGEVTLDQILYNFECYLKASGFVFDGKLEIVEEEQECCQGGCEADEEEDSLRKWNEDLRELEKRIKDQRAEELNELDEYWEELSDEQREETLSKVLKKCGLEQQMWKTILQAKSTAQ